MHADTLPLQLPREEGWGRPLTLALLVHLLVLAVFVGAWLWSPERHVEPAAGDPTIEASMDVSASEARAARQALNQAPVQTQPQPEPAPLPEPAPQDTVPPPQPVPEPRPQDAPTPQQSQAQERVAQPDIVDQERVSAMAISQEKARQEQEAKRRQEQIDLTERQRQEEAEQKQRLARQQEAEQRQKLAEQQAQAQAERDKKLADIRKRREQAERDARLAEQKLRQLADARASQASAASAAAAGSGAAAQASPGQGGTSTDLSAKYAAAIQQAVLAQWVRPDSVPLGQRCTINIRQLHGGQVVDASVSPDCPYDEAGRRSIEAAVLRAQPLPYRGFESVFQRNLTFHFNAQDR